MARRRPTASSPQPAAGDGLAFAALAAVALLTPALGAPTELLLQDTLKSALVAFGTLGAALAFDARRGRQRQRGELLVALGEQRRRRRAAPRPGQHEAQASQCACPGG